MLNAMGKNFSWAKSAESYDLLYQQALADKTEIARGL
jgi:glycogen synthase